MIDELFFIGKPRKFLNICNVYPPTIDAILEDQYYPLYRKLILISGEDIEDEYAEQGIPFDQLPSPLEYIFLIINSSDELKEVIGNGFKFFIHEDVTFLSDLKLILIGNLSETLSTVSSIDELRIINEENFFEFQNMVRGSIGEKLLEPYNPYEHPKIKYFKAKARLRDRVKAESKDGLTFGSTLATICCMGLGISPLNIGELTQCAASILIRYYQEKTKYETDISSLLAGADSKKVKPIYWIRNIEDL